MNKYVVIYSTDSCDSIIYGMFNSYEEADNWIDDYIKNKWDEYDTNNDAHLESCRVKEIS
tara:strand:- start:887 stop:1066 length:180 start_codon:yes stop_codon:yes gene_type:complete